MDAASASTTCRRRFSLLTRPWHLSSRVVALLVLLFLLFCNLPAQYVERLRFGNLPPLVADIGTDMRLEHGWPLTFLARSRDVRFFGPEITARECFEFWKDVDELRLAALLANVAIVVVVALAIGLGFETWRRARKRLTQIHLRDLLAVLLVVSAVGAWFLNERQEFAEQQRFFRPDNSDLRSLYCTHQEGGITWLRACLGAWLFDYLDRPFSVTISEGEGWRQLAKLPNTHRVDVVVPGTTADFRHLAELPNLEALSIQGFDQFERGSGRTIELPQLPTLRGLMISELTDPWRGIDRAPAVEVLAIFSSRVDDGTFHEIESLPKLRELSLNSVKVSAERLGALSNLRMLRALEVARASLDEGALGRLGGFHNLRSLALRNSRIASGDLQALSALKRLETLDLNGVQAVNSQDVARLAELPQLRDLYLTGTLVNADAIPHLIKFRQLHHLVLPRRGFSDADERLLREQLPKCEIHFEP